MKIFAWIISLAAFFAIIASLVVLSLQLGFLNLDVFSPIPIIVETVVDLPPEKTNKEPTSGQAPGATSTLESTTKTVLQQEEAADIKPLERSNPAPKIILTPPVQELKPAIATPPYSQGVLEPQGLVLQTNLQRQAYLGANFILARNSSLDAAAQNKINDMFAGQYFEHASPQGLVAVDLVARAGYEYIAIGENLAMGDYQNDAELVQAWMTSLGHRENILRPGYRDIGVAVGYGIINGRQTWLAVQIFATPKSACPVVDAGLSALIDRDQQTLDDFSQDQASLLAAIDSEKNYALAVKSELETLVNSSSSAAAIQAKREEFEQAVDKANKDINAYNAAMKEMRAVYNRYKAIVGQYNSQVLAYNACLGALK